MAAPSTDLRRWYGHDPTRFEEFHRRYEAELAELRVNRASHCSSWQKVAYSDRVWGRATPGGGTDPGPLAPATSRTSYGEDRITTSGRYDCAGRWRGVAAGLR